MNIKKFWWIFLLPFIPVALNYLLPLGNYSKIGGANSLEIWLNFWATFINTLIFCGITIFVLYKQIQSNSNESKINRRQLKYQIELSKYHNFTQISENFIKYFDQNLILKLYFSWLS
ncbi:MAG: hypothetical protein K2M93_09325, partial [Muribaculaceae bacterium]|nr:hypothetical protein [Muribaculaceae bacterium]